MSRIRELLNDGLAIPACPLALNAQRCFDERRQRALLRYYCAAGAGGVAVGVHTTQFEIRQPQHGLLRPVLELAAEELQNQERPHQEHIVRIGGVVGDAVQAMREAEQLRELRYHVGLLSLAGHQSADETQLIEHCRRVSEVLPIMGFYLQPAVGGRLLSYRFWRQFSEIENVVAIKISPFNRYQTIDVVRAVVDAGRADIALYTGNDDNIVGDLLTEFVFKGQEGEQRRAIVGGLLGHWACWTRNAVLLMNECKRLRALGNLPTWMLTLGAQVTDTNAALFDAANAFRGCIPGIHEVLRRQGLLEGLWCLDPTEELGTGQMQEIDRVYHAYPHLNDDDFVAEHLDEWLA
ncbi:hypothetical protein Q31a_34630 [Aureliella helgolandensis]|uniref:Dihydrodipicolinate synthase family protein n=2 Tax=Aureliella helgolandensis TaxID=2527968 RepID=A0A518G993_9BACT|nr:hypothetical protein Q31a_34630 [Aureliella helgolandensis]